jgi:ketosteroid isomerase-like protein
MSRSGQVLVILIVIIIAIALLSRNAGDSGIYKRTEHIKQFNQSLLNVDRNFYRFSMQNGLGKAFIDFADDSVIIIRDNEFPIIGKAKLAKLYLNHESDFKPLYWDPVKAEASPDGQLGYTFGKWEYQNIDKSGKKVTKYGNYLTVWKKQKDGTWKYIYDGSGSTPGPWAKY